MRPPMLIRREAILSGDGYPASPADFLSGGLFECASLRTLRRYATVALLAGAAVLSLNFLVSDGAIVRSDGLAYFMYAKSIVLDGDTDLSPQEMAEVRTKFAGAD